MFTTKDPRLKALSEAKYHQFRNWFDKRLDDAIAATEQPINLRQQSDNGKYAQRASPSTLYLDFTRDSFCLGALASLSEFVDRLYSGMMHPAIYVEILC